MMFDCFKKRFAKEIPETPIPKNVVAPAHEEAIKYGDKFGRYRYIAYCDLGINSAEHRFWIHDTKHDKILPFKTSHGSGGKNEYPHDGECREVSNVPGSHMSCVGMFKCAETYMGRNGYSLRLDGLSETNSKARPRAIVIHKHGAMNNIRGSISPRSWGCFMFSPYDYKRIIDMLKNGSPLFVVYNK